MKSITFNQDSFPAIYKHADQAAAKHQNRYFVLLGIQYASLFVASAATIGDGLFETQKAVFVYLIALAFAATAQIAAGVAKPDKRWYAARALAESLKTICWRYSMAAEPFRADLDDRAANNALREKVDGLLEAHRGDPSLFLDGMEYGDFVTETMTSLRMAELSVRIQKYRRDRVEDQRDWYIRKAKSNKSVARSFTVATLLSYAAAATLAIGQLANPETQFIWMSEPVLLVAASLLGWSQAKRYGELSASYSLTAHEVSLLMAMFSSEMSQEEFDEAVTDSEFAFSREHTQWLART